MRTLHSAALLAAIACLNAGLSAQALADAARRASAAPQQPATKKYTNDDVEIAKPVLPPVATAVQEGASEVNKGEDGKIASASSQRSAEEVKAADPEPKKTPEYVLIRITQLKAQLANKEKQLRELQVNGDTSGVALVKDQMASLQKELGIHQARVAPRD
jgi:hypothetical protein